MRVISRGTLAEFWSRPARRDAETPLRAWFKEAESADWTTPAEVKTRYPSASVLKDGRVVFNIGGNKYRLVVKLNYAIGIVFIRFVGTHAEYDRIDAEEV
jgi:mRNA interferase HigB